MATDKILDILKKALEMEEKGYKFYKEASQNCKNDITKKTFTFLANNEVLHIDSIKNFYNSLKDNGEFPNVDLDSMKEKRTEDLNIFAKNIESLKEKIKPIKDDIKACEFAMEFENNGYKYYERMLKESGDEKLGKLLKFLLVEENKHYEGIKSLYTYLNDSANWFMYEEGSFPQGG